MAAHQLAWQRHILSGDADIAALDATVFNEPSSHERCRIDGDGKTDTLGRENDRRIHADHVTARCDQRASRVARIEGSVGLNDVIDESARLRAQRPPEGTHDPGGHGALEAVRIADSDY